MQFPVLLVALAWLALVGLLAVAFAVTEGREAGCAWGASRRKAEKPKS
jgi:hypothetical protein